jgi:hypothetical protein
MYIYNHDLAMRVLEYMHNIMYHACTSHHKVPQCEASAHTKHRSGPALAPWYTGRPRDKARMHPSYRSLHRRTMTSTEMINLESSSRPQRYHRTHIPTTGAGSGPCVRPWSAPLSVIAGRPHSPALYSPHGQLSRGGKLGGKAFHARWCLWSP